VDFGITGKILAACSNPNIPVGTCSSLPFIGDHQAVEDSDWLGNLEVTLLSLVEFMKAVVPVMAKRGWGWGWVVNIGAGAPSIQRKSEYCRDHLELYW
jgi:NAD(P)-dependent dehydrogenase (short-subunit alcohol dehydrogenase family)